MLGVDPDLVGKAVREGALHKLVVTYVINPTARPRHAPTAIVGRNIPAGIYSQCDFREDGYLLQNLLTIIPNVHAVRTSFIPAVRMRRNTFAQIAVLL